MQTSLSAPLPSIQKRARLATFSFALVLFTLAGFSLTARAQVTVYTDEGTFNAATAILQFNAETYEGVAPAGGEVQNPDLPSGFYIGSNVYVADGTDRSGYLSLNGSTDCYCLDEAAGTSNAYNSGEIQCRPAAPPAIGRATAFGTDVGSLSINGVPYAYGGNPGDGPVRSHILTH